MLKNSHNCVDKIIRIMLITDHKDFNISGKFLSRRKTNYIYTLFSLSVHLYWMTEVNLESSDGLISKTTFSQI